MRSRVRIPSGPVSFQKVKTKIIRDSKPTRALPRRQKSEAEVRVAGLRMRSEATKEQESLPVHKILAKLEFYPKEQNTQTKYKFCFSDLKFQIFWIFNS